MKKTIFCRMAVVVAIASMALLSACGGGGGPAPAEPVSVNGLDGATGVATGSSFRYTFAKAVDQSTVTAASYFIVPAAAAEAQVVKADVDPAVCDPANALAASVACGSLTSCDLTPAADLDGGAGYAICLTDGIGYLDGTAFAGFMASFTTAGGGYTVGGTVAGLDAGEEVVLQNNAADDLTVSADGAFTFATALADGAAYAVTVLTAPATKTCTVGSGTGTVAGANVTDVGVVCSVDTYTVGGTVAGLGGGEEVVLQNNAADDLTVSADGAFTFATPVADGADYAVTVRTPPAGKSCAVANPAGTIAGANVTDVGVTCSSSAKDITSFTFNVGAEDVDIKDSAVDVEIPRPRTVLTPTIGISGTGIDPASGVAQNFTNPVIYTVTAADGSTKQYTVTVTEDVYSVYSMGAAGPAGGVVFIVPETAGNNTGLYFEAALSDVGTRAWSNIDDVAIGTTSTDIGKGADNTAAIIAQGATSGAAWECGQYSFGGQDDWFLPSYTELEKLYGSKDAVGGFSDTFYWSSLEFNADQAQVFSFAGAGGGVTDKNNINWRVRCVRSFPADTGPAGGIIYYEDVTCAQAGCDRYYEAATINQSDDTVWGTWDLTTDATAQAVGTGRSNTATIIANDPTGGEAARLCDSYDGGLFDDWFLPSKGELDEMYVNRNAIGAFNAAFYWSSSEDSSQTAHARNFGTGASATLQKNVGSYDVRCSRAF